MELTLTCVNNASFETMKAAKIRFHMNKDGFLAFDSKKAFKAAKVALKGKIEYMEVFKKGDWLYTFKK